MARLYIGYPNSPELRQENGYNGVLIDAADVVAAKVAAKAGKPNGSTSDDKLDAWTWAEIAGTAGTLPGAATVLWLEGVRGFGGSRST